MKTQNTRLNITVPIFRVNESRSQPTNQPIKKLTKGRDLQRVQVDGCWSIQLLLRTRCTAWLWHRNLTIIMGIQIWLQVVWGRWQP